MILVLIVGCGQGYVEQTDKFAAQVKSSVNPDELQSWATNLIAKTPVSSPGGVEEKDVPNYVRAIYKDDPPEFVEIQHGDGGSYVQIAYGSGFGHWGLYVGFTNLEMKSDENFYVVQWKPGIFFWNGP